MAGGIIFIRNTRKDIDSSPVPELTETFREGGFHVESGRLRAAGELLRLDYHLYSMLLFEPGGTRAIDESRHFLHGVKELYGLHVILLHSFAPDRDYGQGFMEETIRSTFGLYKGKHYDHVISKSNGYPDRLVETIKLLSLG